ncbi:MAG TPA: hypothetical protein VI172_14725 [Candidatus Dormibacteraeota bacterium]
MTDCPDCAVRPGVAHEDDCDVARCLETGGQRLSCAQRPVVTDLGGGAVGVRPHDCGHNVWTGEWPGDAECREFGWWVQDRCDEGLGFVPCASGAPGAVEDLGRLSRDAVWSRERARWVLPVA